MNMLCSYMFDFPEAMVIALMGVQSPGLSFQSVSSSFKFSSAAT